MTLANLITLSRAYIPGAKATVITDDVLKLIINSAVIDIAAYTRCLKKNKKFAVVADQSEYNLSSVIGDYLVADKPGLWWNDGDQWMPLGASTLALLDKDRPIWRDEDSGDPEEYSINGDVLTTVPAPDTSLVDGFWLYYGGKPVDMVSNDQYPFTGSTTEYTHLSIFDWCIIKFVAWKVNPMLNKDQDATIFKVEYEQEREEKFIIFKSRPDISKDARMIGLGG